MECVSESHTCVYILSKIISRKLMLSETNCYVVMDTTVKTNDKSPGNHSNMYDDDIFKF